MADLNINVTANYTDLQVLKRELVGLEKTAKSSASVFEREYAKVERQIQRSAKEHQRYYNELLKVNTSQKQAAQSASLFSAEIERLSQKYNPLYAASKQYETSLDEINRAHKMGVLTAAQLENQIEKLNADFAAFNNGTAGWENQFVTGGTRAGKSLNRFGMYAQQVGYQVGDFFVQIQSGTNVLVAFSQQATQLAGLIPGVWGAAIGIGISVFSAIGVALMRSKQEAESSKDVYLSLDDALKQLNQTAANTSTTFNLLQSSMSSEAALRVQQEIYRLEELIRAAELEREQRSGRSKGRGPTAATQALIDELEVLKEILRLDKQRVEDIQEQANAAGRVYKARKDEEKELKKLLDIQMAILNFGKGSAEHAAVMAKYAEEEYRTQLNKLGIYNEQQDKLVALWKLLGDITEENEKLKKEAELVKNTFAAMGSMSFESTQAQILALATALGVTLAEAERLLAVFIQLGGKTSVGKEQVTGKKETKPVASGGNVVTGSSGSGAIEEDPFQVLNDYIEAQMRQIEVERTLLTLGEEAARIKEIEYDLMEKLGDGYEEVGAAAVSAAAQEIAAAEKVNEALEEKREKMEEIQDVLSSGFEDFFMSIIDGSKTVGEAFADLAQYIISELLRILVIKPLVDSLAKSFSGLFGGLFATGGVFGVNGVMPYAKGGVFGSGGVTAFANGGVVSSPTIFPFANGVGLMGEAGPEAIMPLKRTPSGDLGVIAQGAGGGTPVNVVVNNYGKEDATVNQQPNGDIVVTVGKAVAQDIANGGATYQAMKKTFGLSQTVKRRG